MTTADHDVINGIRAEGLGTATSKVMNIVSGMIDLHGGRLTGSPQAEKADAWTVERMKSYGFANCRLEPRIDEPGNPNKGFPRGWQNDRFFMRSRTAR